MESELFSTADLQFNTNVYSSGIEQLLQPKYEPQQDNSYLSLPSPQEHDLNLQYLTNSVTKTFTANTENQENIKTSNTGIVSISNTGNGSFKDPRLDIVKHCEKNQDGKYECPIADCSKTFARRFNLKSHFASSHICMKRFSCAQCGREFARNADVKRHHIKLHQRISK